MDGTMRKRLMLNAIGIGSKIKPRAEQVTCNEVPSLLLSSHNQQYLRPSMVHKILPKPLTFTLDFSIGTILPCLFFSVIVSALNPILLIGYLHTTIAFIRFFFSLLYFSTYEGEVQRSEIDESHASTSSQNPQNLPLHLSSRFLSRINHILNAYRKHQTFLLLETIGQSGANS